MIELKDLKCLQALARHGHFARAAQECGMSQPAFSMRIQNLEKRLCPLTVRRGNRFHHFTPTGDMVIEQGAEILAAAERLLQDIRHRRGEVSGTLAIGVIPTAVAQAARLATWMREEHPEITIQITTCTSLDIQQGLDASRFDAGITYGEGVSKDLLRIEPLYDENFLLLAPNHMVPEGTTHLTWTEAAQLPITLLDPGMQNRRIIDRVFQDLGVLPNVFAEMNGFNAAIVMAIEGAAATIVPKVLVDAFGDLNGAVALPLQDPVITKPVCLVTTLDPALPNTVQALRHIALDHFS